MVDAVACAGEVVDSFAGDLEVERDGFDRGGGLEEKIGDVGVGDFFAAGGEGLVADGGGGGEGGAGGLRGRGDGEGKLCVVADGGERKGLGGGRDTPTGWDVEFERAFAIGVVGGDFDIDGFGGAGSEQADLGRESE